MADFPRKLHGRKMLHAQQAVDIEMPLVVERAQIAEDGRVNSGNRSTRAHRLGHAGGDHVDFVAAGDGQTEIGIENAGLEKRTQR